MGEMSGDALQDLAQFSYVRVAHESSELFGEFVTNLCKIALKRQPWGVAMLQALAHGF